MGQDGEAGKASKEAPAEKPAAAAAGGGKKDDGGIPNLKLVLVGDTAVGKSCLITNYLHNTFSENYEPTVLDVYKGTKSVNKTQVNLELHDTSGDDNLQANRKVQYQGAHCFMICVAVNKRSSFDNIAKWKEEI